MSFLCYVAPSCDEESGDVVPTSDAHMVMSVLSDTTAGITVVAEKRKKES